MSNYCRSRLAATAPGLPIVLLLGMIAFLGGCGGRSAAVSGKVRYKDQLLTTGEVSFIAADGKSRSGLIGADGSYQISEAPIGPVTVVVVARQVEGGPVGGSPMAAGLDRTRRPVVKSLIPARFADPEQSGLRFEVVAGKQIKDIDLPD